MLVALRGIGSGVMDPCSNPQAATRARRNDHSVRLLGIHIVSPAMEVCSP